MLDLSILRISPDDSGEDTDSDSNFPAMDDEYDNYSSLDDRPDYQKDYYSQGELEDCPSQIVSAPELDFDDDEG